MVLVTCYVNILSMAHLKSFPKVWGTIKWKRLWPRVMANEECSGTATVQRHCFMDIVHKRDLWVIASCLFLHTADILFEEFNLRNDSILNNLVSAPWRVVCFDIQHQWRYITGQIVLLSVLDSTQLNIPRRMWSCIVGTTAGSPNNY